MALTKIGKEGITGISNSSNASAITINSSEQVGIGTTSVSNKLEVHSGDATNIVAKSTNGNGGYLNYSGLSSTGTTTFSVTHNGKIYVADGIQLGGTGAANYLGDYEEGTWTPNADGGSTTHHDQFGFYTKVGNLVHAYFNIRINAYNGGSAVRYLFGGLPFTASSTSGKSGAGSIFYFGNIHTSAVALFCRVDPNNSSVFVSGTTGSVASMANINHPWATNNAQIIGFVMYRTD